MRRAFSAVCCGVLTIAPVFYSTFASAQNKVGPFGPLIGQRIDLAQLVPAEPAPEAALPANPVPPAQIAFPLKVGLPAGAVDELCRCVGEDTSAESAAARIRQSLRAPLEDSGFEFNDQPMEEAFGLMQEEYGIPIKLDLSALKEINKQPDEPVTINLRGISLGAALRLMLHELGLTYVIHNEVLLVTTPDAAEQILQTCVYDVRDLLQGGKKGNDFDSLIDSIVSCIATESWAENGGGEAEIRPLQPGFLIISQTQAVHDEVRSLLNTIRQLKSVPVAAMAGAPPQASPSDEVETQFYTLQFGGVPVTDELRAQVQDLIVKSRPGESWNGTLTDGQPVLLAVVNDRVIVRNKPGVQSAVEELLADSGMLMPNDFCGNDAGSGGVSRRSPKRSHSQSEPTN